jgi:REP element-mobilizing transposase RayT
MPRKPRVEYSGAFYHVITRGNQRQNLFHDNKDREFYLDRLEQYRKRYGFTIYAYVLMSNHVHLLIETGKTPLSTIMQGLQFSYTRYFNRRGMTVKELGSCSSLCPPCKCMAAGNIAAEIHYPLSQ